MLSPKGRGEGSAGKDTYHLPDDPSLIPIKVEGELPSDFYTGATAQVLTHIYTKVKFKKRLQQLLHLKNCSLLNQHGGKREGWGCSSVAECLPGSHSSIQAASKIVTITTAITVTTMIKEKLVIKHCLVSLKS